MFIRKYWLPLTVFLVAIVGVGLYLRATQPPKAPIQMDKAIKPIEKPAEPPTVEVPKTETSQGGHFHADGTWHAGPHEPASVATPPPAVQRRQRPSEAQRREAPRPARVVVPQQPTRPEGIPSPEDIAKLKAEIDKQRTLPKEILSPEYIEMVKAAVQTSIDLFDARTEDGLTVPEFNLARRVVITSRWDAGELRQMYYDTGDRSYREKYKQILALDDPYREFVDARYPRPKLTADQLSQIEKAADELDAILPKTSIDGKPVRNPYRERLKAEVNR